MNIDNQFQELPNGVKVKKQFSYNYKKIDPSISSVELPMDEANIFEVILNSSISIYPQKAVQPGSDYLIFFRQNATGSNTVTFDSRFVFVSGDENTVKADANSVSVLSFVVLSDGNLYCTPIKQY